MGTWGTGPFDDDGTADWFCDAVEDMLSETIAQTILSRGLHGQRNYQPGRGAVRTALLLCSDDRYRITAPTFEKAKLLLQLALADARFFKVERGGVSLEAELRKELEDELVAVEAALAWHAAKEEEFRARFPGRPQRSVTPTPEKPS